MIEKISEESVRQQPGGLRRELTEGISPTEKSVTVILLTQGVAGSQESCELSGSETHHRDVVLQQLHCLIGPPA